MDSINTCVISGNIGKDPISRTSQSGTTFLSFSVAVTESRKARNGGEGYEKFTHWVDCTVIGKKAEWMGRDLAKGMHVTAIGRLQQEKWVNKDGEDRTRLVLLVENVKYPFVERAPRPVPNTRTVFDEQQPPDGADDIPF